MKGMLVRPELNQAIREGRKLVTRRLGGLKEINKEPDRWMEVSPQNNATDVLFTDKYHYGIWVKPRYRVREVVYVKEAWAHRVNIGVDYEVVYYKLNGSNIGDLKWRSPLFMPEWAARTFIQITGVRAERLQDITEEEAIAEGMTGLLYQKATGALLTCARDVFQWYWDSINPNQKWASNPWVFRYSFVLQNKGGVRNE